MTFRTTGGLLDFYIFLGPTPTDVISQYTEQVFESNELAKYNLPNLPNLVTLDFEFLEISWLYKCRQVIQSFEVMWYNFLQFAAKLNYLPPLQ